MHHPGSQLCNESQKRNIGTCFHFLRDDRDATLRTSLGTGIGSTVRLQHRCFGSAAAKIQRNPLFSTLNSDDISYFKGVLGEKNVIQDEDRLMTANTDWMRKYKGSSKLLLQPRSTEEVGFFFYLLKILMQPFAVGCLCLVFSFLHVKRPK